MGIFSSTHTRLSVLRGAHYPCGGVGYEKLLAYSASSFLFSAVSRTIQNILSFCIIHFVNFKAGAHTLPSVNYQRFAVAYTNRATLQNDRFVTFRGKTPFRASSTLAEYHSIRRGKFCQAVRFLRNSVNYNLKYFRLLNRSAIAYKSVTASSL